MVRSQSQIVIGVEIESLIVDVCVGTSVTAVKVDADNVDEVLGTDTEESSSEQN